MVGDRPTARWSLQHGLHGPCPCKWCVSIRRAEVVRDEELEWCEEHGHRPECPHDPTDYDVRGDD